uniref:Uncharacterized protein n=1 Tax=Oryza sativa subsp. japonica TaxID=39947 RepID=Q2R6H2_ORYSJ|nr:hypothetical protein LOC_Os11g20060 [Oryza sativa Japonica Group]
MTILHRVAEALPSSAHLRRLIIISRPPEKAIVMLPSQSVPKITRVAEDRIYLVLHCYDVAKTSGVLTLLVATYALRHHQHLLNLCNTGVPLLGDDDERTPQDFIWLRNLSCLHNRILIHSTSNGSTLVASENNQGNEKEKKDEEEKDLSIAPCMFEECSIDQAPI